MKNKLLILDCTIRDGGYYTNWDFSPQIIENYIKAMDILPIDFIEIGYRNLKQKNYFGEFFYTPINTIKQIQKITKKPLAIILNERDLELDHILNLLEPCKNKVSMVRMAIDPINVKEAKEKALVIKKMGFKVAFNVMYLSTWLKDKQFLKQLNKIEEIVDYFYMVDSFGAVFPNEVKKLIKEIKKRTSVKLGFHGHNNLELALANTLAAIEEGVSIVDSTVMGMGRGSGNLKTELLLSIISKENEINFNSLTKVLEDFNNLNKNYQWGTNLPYMIAGIHSIPQKQIMEWLGKKFYSFNNIIRALNSKIQTNKRYSFKTLSANKKHSKALIIGGGHSINLHKEALKEFIKTEEELIIIYSSSRYLNFFNTYDRLQYICLIGNENERIGKLDGEIKNINLVIPPAPREIGTFIPDGLDHITFELDDIELTDEKIATHCSISIQTAISLGLKKVFIAGFDGYMNQNKGSKEMELFRENDLFFNNAQKKLEIISLTPTLYSNINTESIYSLIK